ncbi:glycoside hydrolase family 65 protein [Pontibacter locisalis]|uniref:Glycoside hydrolase family 65 protein n=1 Tax=Pontibacter locisalis TaxID=1719035 RepID=A0ABW5INI7_9BACT
MMEMDKAWCIHFDHYDPADEGRREALLALGNGCLASRAAAPESREDKIHYPGTYRVGCYNELITQIQGQDVKNESIVNLPNWLPFSFRMERSDWFSLDDVTILDYEQTLHMQQGLLTRKVRFSDEQGRQTLVQERRFVSMAQPNLMALSIALTPLNWSGKLELQSNLDGRVINNKVTRYAPFNKVHLEILNTGEWGENGIELLARTNQSSVTVALAARTNLWIAEQEHKAQRVVNHEDDHVSDYRRISLREGEEVRLEKIAALYTSLDIPEDACARTAQETLLKASDFDTLFTAHKDAWQNLWQRSYIEVDAADQLCYFRLHIFHILQNFSPHTAKMDVGVPPSGWQGEEYHGQVFWDELFVFPFLTFHFPDSARALLQYRYRRLDTARKLAKENGYRGAMFPWRSASDGEEETPPFQLNPISGEWMEDRTCLQRHVGAAVAYNIWYYAKVTGDQQFLADCGAELILEIARFWASISKHNPALNRYEIHGVVGPDEYQTMYPEANSPGVSNNTYTNVMAAWTLCQARRLFEQLNPQRQQELMDKLALSSEEFEHWDEVSRRMRIVFREDGTISQFEGFDQLKEFDLQKFREKHGHQRLDWALDAMGDSVEKYRISKQADTAVLLYLFTPAELVNQFERLGYSLNEDILKRTITNHLSQTAHESSLSRFIYAGALASLSTDQSWSFYKEAQQIDMSPEDKGASEGIHLGAMGGTLAVLLHRYLGIKVKSDYLVITPSLPEALSPVRISLNFRGAEYVCEISRTAEPLVKVAERVNAGHINLNLSK